MSPDRADQVVEMEFQFPSVREVKMPRVDLEPARHVAEKAVIFGIGSAVLVARGIASVVGNAVRAGEEEAENPGPVASALLRFVRYKEKAEPLAAEEPITVPVLPIADYDSLSSDEVVEQCAGLSTEQLSAVRDYEKSNQNRSEVLDAIDGMMGA